MCPLQLMQEFFIEKKNYTENWSAQAKRHYEGGGVNPPLSLEKTSTNRIGAAGFELTSEYSN